MNVYIMVDIEGISGIYCKEQVIFGQPRFNEGRAYMTEEVNVCVEACKKAGADKVYVRDAHGGSYTLIWEKLSENADFYACGISGNERYPGIEDCDGVILLGYHSMAGTIGGVLEHTFSSASVQNYWINGEKAGEVAVDAGLLGELGKPVIMVSGDDKVCEEAKELLPDVVTAEVKKGMTTYGAMLLPKGKAHKIIHDKTIEAVNKLSEMKPLVFEAPIEFKIELMERIPIPTLNSKPYMNVIDGRTYSVEGNSLKEAFDKAR